VTAANAQWAVPCPTPTLAGEAVQAVVGPGAVGQCQRVGGYGHGKGRLDVGELRFQEASGSL
jgi:hypothetical protein